MDSVVDYITEQLSELTSIPSPTGFTSKVTAHVSKTLESMGFAPELSNKGNVLVELGGKGRPLVLASHVDTLGAMVRSVKDNGRLRPHAYAEGQIFLKSSMTSSSVASRGLPGKQASAMASLARTSISSAFMASQTCGI